MTSPSNRAELIGAALSDPARIAALLQTGLLDTEPEESFDRLTRLASRLLEVPTAVVSLVTGDREFFKSAIGLPEPFASRRQSPLSHSFSQYVVAGEDVLSVADARADPELSNNPAVAEMGARAYLGVPIRLNHDGPVLGALGAIDSKPRAWSEDDYAVLGDLAAIAAREIEHRMIERGLGTVQTPGRFARLINLLPVGLYMCDGRGQLVFYNDRSAALWGNAPPLPAAESEAFAKRPLSHLDGTPVEGHDFPAWQAIRERAIATNREFVMGADRTLLISWGPTLGPGDQLVGAIVVMQDVTEARGAARLRDDLLSLVSHELRTPLTVINGMARALERRIPATPASEERLAVSDIILAGQRMERVVENMLLLSRLEHEAAETEPVLVSAAVGAALDRHRRDFPRSVVETDIRNPGLMVLAVPSWLHLILVNLFSNAEQYGDGRLPHRFIAYADDGVARLSVCNSGLLTGAGDFSSWFEPFYRGGGTAAIVAGAGLGLTVARRLAEAQQGATFAEPWTPGPGIVVTLTLPRPPDG